MTGGEMPGGVLNHVDARYQDYFFIDLPDQCLPHPDDYCILENPENL